jgi:hypothetical protein
MHRGNYAVPRQADPGVVYDARRTRDLADLLNQSNGSTESLRG